ncbi:hypothetical protein [Burkholderia ubonensis]|uniref:hypothetical protein n=1 Tax=Burkholderia ubonensis TaxID=101571 RepID=UPI000A5D4CFD|nr:hypothetical protein [Burkholderia ubonensis]
MNTEKILYRNIPANLSIIARAFLVTYRRLEKWRDARLAEITRGRCVSEQPRAL